MVSISLSSDRAIRRRWSSTFAETDADPLLVAVDLCFAAIDTSSMFYRGSRRCRATVDRPQSVREPEAAREPKGLSALAAYQLAPMPFWVRAQRGQASRQMRAQTLARTLSAKHRSSKGGSTCSVS